MTPVPPIADPELLARLALSDDDFKAGAAQVLAGFGRDRPCDDAAIEHACGYPWARPATSFLLRDGAVQPAVDPGELRGRHRLLAFGSNGAPEALTRKLAHFEDVEDRTVLVVAGAVTGYDVVASSTVTYYGSMPATLAASPGTRVRVSTLYVTPRQFEQLTWSELTYRLIPLPGDAWGYESRFGAFAPDGEPLALTAIPADGRRFRALTQQQLLDRAARLVLGDDAARAADLVRAVHRDFAGLVPALRDLWAQGLDPGAADAPQGIIGPSPAGSTMPSSTQA